MGQRWCWHLNIHAHTERRAPWLTPCIMLGRKRQVLMSITVLTQFKLARWAWLPAKHIRGHGGWLCHSPGVDGLGQVRGVSRSCWAQGTRDPCPWTCPSCGHPQPAAPSHSPQRQLAPWSPPGPVGAADGLQRKWARGTERPPNRCHPQQREPVEPAASSRPGPWAERCPQ